MSSRSRNYDSPPNDSGNSQGHDSAHRHTRHREWSEDWRRNNDSPPTTDNDSGGDSQWSEDNDDTDDTSPKWPRKSTVDRIGMLPDCLLLHILSFLPIEDAIKTDVLSKRWRNLWTYLQALLFRFSHSYFSNRDKIRDFVTFVTKTLVLCNGSKLKNFRVDFDYESRFAPSVQSWIRLATSRGTEKLHLVFCFAEGCLCSKDIFVLPQILYTNSSFRELWFSSCSVSPKGVVAWNSLKKLSIGNMKLSEDSIQKILEGSPVLGERILCGEKSCGDRVVNFNTWQRILAPPNLRSLEILGCFGKVNCQLVDVSSLVDATLDCSYISYPVDSNDDYELFQNVLRGLLESLVHVKNLTLGTWALLVLSIMETKGICSPLSKCEYLTLHTSLEQSVFPGITSLLESSPFLETLVIAMSCFSDRKYFRGKLTKLYNFNGEHWWTSQKKTFDDASENN